MKRLTTFILFIIGALLLLAGCSSNEDNFTSKSYTADGTQTKSIYIDVRDREIDVLPSNDNQIYIDYYESDKEYYEISISNNNELTMTAATNKDWKDYIGGKAAANNRKITLRIPDTLVSSLVLSTTNDDISLPAVTVTDSISLSTNGGNIEFEKLNAGNSLTLKTKNGDINGTINGNYDDYSISCDVKKGESNLPAHKEGGEKVLSITVNNGDSNIDFESVQ